MRTEYEAVVDRPIEAVWASLTDVDSVLAALPGAAFARDGDGVSGSLKCKLGATQVTYRLNVRVDVGEAEFRTAILAITGKEARGSGTVTASLTVALRNGAPNTRIEVTGDIAATGRGEKADEAAWQRVIESLVNALLPPTVAEPDPVPVSPRPPLAVAPPPGEVRRPEHGGRSDIQRQIRFALIAVAVLLMLRRFRRRSTSQ